MTIDALFLQRSLLYIITGTKFSKNLYAYLVKSAKMDEKTERIWLLLMIDFFYSQKRNYHSERIFLNILNIEQNI